MDNEVRGTGLDGRLAQLMVSRLVERVDPLAAFLYIPVDHIPEIQDYQYAVLDGFGAPGAVELEPVEPENLHITLLYIDKVKDDELDQFFNDVNQVMPMAFQVEVSHSGTFPEAEDKPVILHISPSPSLVRLQTELYNAAFSMGLPLSIFSKPENFKPHISVAYNLEPPDMPIPDLPEPIRISIDHFAASRPEYERLRTVYLPTIDLSTVLVEQADGFNDGPPPPAMPQQIGGSIPDGATTDAEDRRNLQDAVERPVGPEEPLSIRILYDPNLEKVVQSVNTFDTFDITLGREFYTFGLEEKAVLLARALGQDLARRLLLGPGGAHEWQRADAMMAAPPSEVGMGFRFVWGMNSLQDAVAETYAVLSIGPEGIEARGYWNASDWIGMAVTEQPQFEPAQLPDLLDLAERIGEETIFPGVTMILDESEKDKPTLEELQEEDDEEEEAMATGTVQDEADDDEEFGISKSDLLLMLRGESLTYGPLRRVLTLEDGPFLMIDDGQPIERIMPEPITKGGKGSGHHGHKGRPGEVGGSEASGESDFSNVPNRLNLSTSRQTDPSAGVYIWGVRPRGGLVGNYSYPGMPVYHDDLAEEVGLNNQSEFFARGMIVKLKGMDVWANIIYDMSFNDPSAAERGFKKMAQLIQNAGLSDQTVFPYISFDGGINAEFIKPDFFEERDKPDMRERIAEALRGFVAGAARLIGRGGAGSGHHGHEGREGKIGGSEPGSGGAGAGEGKPKSGAVSEKEPATLAASEKEEVGPGGLTPSQIENLKKNLAAPTIGSSLSSLLPEQFDDVVDLIKNNLSLDEMRELEKTANQKLDAEPDNTHYGNVRQAVRTAIMEVEDMPDFEAQTPILQDPVFQTVLVSDLDMGPGERIAPITFAQAQNFEEKETTAQAWAEEHFPAEYEEPVHEALFGYKRFFYGTINLRLRLGEVGEIEDEETDQMISSIDSAMDLSTVPEDVIVYRGMNIERITESGSALVGRQFMDDGYVSASLSSVDPGRFQASKDNGIMAVIRVPQGTSAVYMDNRQMRSALEINESDIPEEEELLLDRGLTYRIVDYQPTQDKIYLEIVNG